VFEGDGYLAGMRSLRRKRATGWPIVNPATGRLVAIVTSFEDITQRERVMFDLERRHLESVAGLAERTRELRAAETALNFAMRSPPVGTSTPSRVPTTLVQRLSAVPGLEVDLALCRVKGSTTALERQLRTFASTYCDGVEDLLTPLSGDDTEPWRASCRSLRSDCVSIGAMALVRRIDEIDEPLQRSHDPDALQRLGEHLHRAVLSLVSKLGTELASDA
jgi:hypothetical protein